MTFLTADAAVTPRNLACNLCCETSYGTSCIHSKKCTNCSGLMKTGLNNVVLPTLFKVINNTEDVDEPELACNQV